MAMVTEKPDSSAAFERLAELLGERFTTAEAVCQHHGVDESWHPPLPPDAVVFPESTAEVAEVVRICAAHRLPLIPFGAGTSLEGHVLAPHGGVSIDMTRMNRVLAVHADDLDAVVQAGVTRRQLDRRLNDQGLFFPVDPGADATFGGMAATRASGTNAVRYGTLRENVLALEVVLADGQVIRTGTRARKSSAGYDLTRLFIGSEGTLGILTELTVRVYGLPEAMAAAVVSFADLGAAVETASRVIQLGVPVARIELLDPVMLAAVNRESGLDYPVRPTLFLEFHGSPAAVAEQAGEVGEVAREHGGGDFRWATEEGQRQRLWAARHRAYYAALALRPGARGFTTDVCVPISRLAECILATREDLDRSTLEAPLVGHVGDGNFHLILLADPADQEQLAEAQRLHERLVERALAMDGTCTGEHGVGFGKSHFLVAEHGPALDVMAGIKRALDPLGILNPGKILPD